jgi:hypothetical protein
MDFMPWVGTRNAYFANHYARQYQRDLLKQWGGVILTLLSWSTAYALT